jgi:hypothetical protein
MAFGPGTTGSHRASDTPPAIVRVADVAVDDLAGDATDAVDMASERSAAPPGDRPGTARSPGAALPAPETMDFATAKRNAEQEPTHASTDRVTVGVDADEAVAATATAGGAYADQLQDWTERSRP